MAVLIAFFQANQIRSQAIDEVVEDAVDVAAAVINVLDPADLELPMVGNRYDVFNEFVNRSIISKRTARVKVWAKDGTVIYSNDPLEVGNKFPSNQLLLRALRGENATKLNVPENVEHQRERHLGTLMQVYTPIIFPGSTEPQGALEIYRFYAPVAARINSMRNALYLQLSVAFAALYASLVAVVWGGCKTITAQRNRMRSFTDEFETRTGQLTNEIAERKLAEDALRLRTQELEAHFEIASILTQPGKFEERAIRVLDEVARIAGADWVTLRRLDKDGQGLQLVAVSGPLSLRSAPIPVLSAGESLSAKALRQGEAFVTNNYPAHPDAKPDMVAMGVNSVVLMPLKAHGCALGLLNVVSQEPDHFTPELVRLLTGIGDVLGTLLDNTGLQEQVDAGAEEMAVADEVARIITSTLDIGQAYEQFATEMRKLVDFDRTGIYSVDRDAGTIEFQYLRGAIQPGRYTGDLKPLSGTETEIVIASGETVVREDIRSDPVFPTDPDLISAGLRSSIKVPLVAKGAVVGVLSLYSCQVGPGVADRTCSAWAMKPGVGPGPRNVELESLLDQDPR